MITETTGTGLSELSYAQLAIALASSVNKRRLYWAAFTAAAAMIAAGPADELEETSAEMRGHLAAVEAQDAMTTAIITEIGRRNA